MPLAIAPTNGLRKAQADNSKSATCEESNLRFARETKLICHNFSERKYFRNMTARLAYFSYNFKLSGLRNLAEASF